MDIPVSSARQIVEELGGILDEKVNVMDSSGEIVASTDPERVGELHMGALRIIKNNLPILVVEDNDLKKGVRAGINLPVLFEGKIAGVVGVTGDPEKLSKDAVIIQKMTEILLINTYQNTLLEKDKRRRSTFLQEWLFREESYVSDTFRDRGMQLGVDVRMPRRVLVVHVEKERRNFGAEAAEELDVAAEKKLLELAGKEQFVAFRVASRMVVLVGDSEDGPVLRFAHRIQACLQEVCGAPVSIGIDQRSGGQLSLHQSYLQAERALKACFFEGEGLIRLFSDINVEMVVTAVPKTIRREFVQKIFKDMDEMEIRYYLSLLDTFYQCNGSITKAAEKLYMHKNTLQYKLKKLGERTGYDPRSYYYSTLYGMALLFQTYDDRNLY